MEYLDLQVWLLDSGQLSATFHLRGGIRKYEDKAFKSIIDDVTQMVLKKKKEGTYYG